MGMERLESIVLKKEFNVDNISFNKDGVYFSIFSDYLGSNSLLTGENGDGTFYIKLNPDLAAKNKFKKIGTGDSLPKKMALILQYVGTAKEKPCLNVDEIVFDCTNKNKTDCADGKTDIEYVAVFKHDPPSEDYNTCPNCSCKELKKNPSFIMCEEIAFEITQKEYRLINMLRKNVGCPFVMQVSLAIEYD